MITYQKASNTFVERIVVVISLVFYLPSYDSFRSSDSIGMDCMAADRAVDSGSHLQMSLRYVVFIPSVVTTRHYVDRERNA